MVSNSIVEEMGDVADFAYLARPNHWVTRDALAYWQKIRGSKDLPSRADLDPADIPDLLPNLVLLDVLYDPQDFYYRLVGTTNDSFLSTNHTGKRMSELPRQCPPSQIWQSCCSVVESRRPLFSAVPYVGTKRQFIRTEDVILPLAPPHEPVNMLLVAVAYISKSDSKYPLPETGG